MIKRDTKVPLILGVIFIIIIFFSLGIVKFSEINQKNLPDKLITLKFITKVVPSLSWNFRSKKTKIDVKIGQVYKIEFDVENYGSNISSGKAIYDVYPNFFEKYFVELDCFCYKKQTLLSGEKSTYSIIFYIDAELFNNPEHEDIKTVNISYTFLNNNGWKIDLWIM